MNFDLGAGLELIRPWMTTAFIGSILAMLVKLYVDNRKMRLAEKSRSEDYQLQVSADGRSNLQFVIDNLARDIARADERATKADARATKAESAHESCERKLDVMHEERRGDREKLDGLARQFIAFAESAGRAIPPGNQSPEITTMLRQLEELGRAARDVSPPA